MAAGEPVDRRGQGRRQRLALLWTPLSLFFHGALAYSLVAGAMTCTPDPMGSHEVELDVMAPRLAPPLRVNGTARDLSRGHDDDKTQPAKVLRRETSLASRRHTKASTKALRRETTLVSQQHRVYQPRVAVSPRRENAIQDPVSQRDKKRRPENDLFRTMAAVDPEGDIPFHVAKALQQEKQRRGALRAEGRALAQASEARVKTALARMNAVVNASGGRGRGELPRIGLRFFLSGRRVASSRVVRPPEPLRLPRSVCTVRRLGLSPTTVRMLVSKDGDVTVAYIKRTSGDRRFDRCARKTARAIRFRPGEDLAGHPLNVWIHLIVEPRGSATASAAGV
ncbi:MAG: energy transducer TonB [Deltaproteobacteria bacterium]|nr:energy transducer TonB [Deltaproteobacteria bacterium]